MCIYSIITIVEERAKNDFIKKNLILSTTSSVTQCAFWTALSDVMDALISVFDFDFEIA